MEQIAPRDWMAMPADAADIGFEFAPPELGMPELAAISQVGRLPDGRLLVQATWGAITQARSGRWVTTGAEEIAIIEQIVASALAKREARDARNSRAIAWMDRGE